MQNPEPDALPAPTGVRSELPVDGVQVATTTTTTTATATTSTAPVTEIGGPPGPEPTRYGDWEKNGRCIDF